MTPNRVCMPIFTVCRKFKKQHLNPAWFGRWPDWMYILVIEPIRRAHGKGVEPRVSPKPVDFRRWRRYA